MTARKNVLVIEDERPLLNVIIKKLKSKNLNTMSARSVAEAEDKLNTASNLSAIWLDHYLLGSKSGLDFVKNIKTDGRYDKVPIYVVSNTASDEKVGVYTSLGIKKYYVKADHSLDEIVSDLLDNII